MIFPKKEVVEKLKQEYPVGTRIKLVKMFDDKAPAVGTCGTVYHVDDTGTIFAKWDTGSRLGIIFGVDKCEKVKEEK